MSAKNAGKQNETGLEHRENFSEERWQAEQDRVRANRENFSEETPASREDRCFSPFSP